MTSDEVGLWAMLACWASAIGGIILSIQWAKSRHGKSPASKEVILISLKKRLASGEMSEQEYNKKVKAL